MPKVWCATIECKHNKGNQCRAKEINLTDGYINTVHQGRKQVWGCRAFEESEAFKEMCLAIKGIVRGESE